MDRLDVSVESVNESSKLESGNIRILKECSVYPTAKTLDLPEDDVEHCIFANTAVKVLIAVVVSDNSLISSLTHFNVFDGRRLNSVA